MRVGAADRFDDLFLLFGVRRRRGSASSAWPSPRGCRQRASWPSPSDGADASRARCLRVRGVLGRLRGPDMLVVGVFAGRAGRPRRIGHRGRFGRRRRIRASDARPACRSRPAPAGSRPRRPKRAAFVTGAWFGRVRLRGLLARRVLAVACSPAGASCPSCAAWSADRRLAVHRRACRIVSSRARMRPFGARCGRARRPPRWRVVLVVLGLALRRALPRRSAPAGRRPGSGSSRDGFR